MSMFVNNPGLIKRICSKTKKIEEVYISVDSYDDLNEVIAILVENAEQGSNLIINVATESAHVKIQGRNIYIVMSKENEQ